MMRMRSLPWLAGVVALALGFALDSSSVVAQDPTAQAREFFARGQTAYQQGDYEEAVELWTEAYELDPRPLLLYNLAVAQERLNHLAEAVELLDRFLEEAQPETANLADARARRATIRERLSRTSIRVVGGPVGAHITVDGEDWGVTPRPDPIQVQPGTRIVRVEDDRGGTFTARVVVPAGQSVDIDVVMNQRSEGDAIPVGPVVLFSTAGAAVVVASVLGALAFEEADRVMTVNDAAADSARGFAIGSDIAFGTAAAAAATGLVWLIVELTDGGGEAEGQTTRMTPRVVVDGRGVEVGIGMTAAF